MTAERVRRQTRRRIFLEILSLVVPLASAVYFSAQFIGEWSPSSTLLATVATIMPLVAYWIWHRSRFPADITPPTGERTDDADDEDESGGWWGPITILLFLVSVVGVVIAGIVAGFVLPLLVILAFVVGYGPSLGDVAITTGAMLGVSFVLEFGVLFPLARLWNLDPEADSESLDQFCPTPRN